MDSAVNNSRPLEVLIVSVGRNDGSRLRDVLERAGNGVLRVTVAPSVNDACQLLANAKFNLIVIDGKRTDVIDDHFTQPSTSAARVVFTEDGSNESATESTLQSIFCNRARGCHLGSQCLALAVIDAINIYRQQRQRQDSEEMLQKLQRTVEQSPDLVMITDRACVLEYVNPAFEALTGYRKEEVVGQTLGILKSEQQPGELYEEMWDVVLSGRTFHGIVVNRKKNGETFILEKSITPLRNASGEITHFISTGRDITDQRRLEIDLQQAQKMDAIGRLAGGVAHDFNNLLMVISAYAELSHDSLAPEHPLRGKLGEIVSASRRAADLTRQLLAFGRKQIRSPQILDLNTVLPQIVRVLPRLIGEDIQLTFAPGGNLGRIQMDPVQIEQIVMNLAANARDAMPCGGQLTIETENVQLEESYRQRHNMVPQGDYVLLRVSDSGAGIPEGDLGHIFEPFYTTKEEGKGTGLGLATVYGIVKQNGGFIWVYSEPGFGTTFKIYFPRQTATAQALQAPALPEVPCGCETLLLVEDEAAVRRPAREFLTQKGYTVLETANGEEALRISRGYCGPIDLLISDVVMPRMSGPALAELLSAERPRMKVLFMSGYAENTVLRHGKIDLAARLLEKPFGLNVLARKIREVLNGSEPRANAAGASR